MAIFKITREDGAPKVSMGVTEVEEADEVREAMQLVGDAPGSKGEAVKTEPVGGEALSGEGKKDIVVKIDGPLGRYFTESLNKILAIEGMLMTMMATDEEEEDQETRFDIKPDLVVTAMDGSALKFEDVTALNEVLKRYSTGDVVIAAESASMKMVTRELSQYHVTCKAHDRQLCQRIELAVGRAMEVIRRKMR